MPGTPPPAPDLPHVSDEDWPLPVDCPNVASFDDVLATPGRSPVEPAPEASPASTADAGPKP